MGTLSEDLEKYAHEAYSRKDITAGLKLLAELAGLVSLFSTAIALSTVTIPFLGPTVSRSLIVNLSRIAYDHYMNLSAGERKSVRAAIRFINPVGHITGLVDRLDDTMFFLNIAEKAEGVEEWGDKFGVLWGRLRGKD